MLNCYLKFTKYLRLFIAHNTIKKRIPTHISESLDSERLRIKLIDHQPFSLREQRKLVWRLFSSYFCAIPYDRFKELVYTDEKPATNAEKDFVNLCRNYEKLLRKENTLGDFITIYANRYFPPADINAPIIPWLRSVFNNYGKCFPQTSDRLVYSLLLLNRHLLDCGYFPVTLQEKQTKLLMSVDQTEIGQFLFCQLNESKLYPVSLVFNFKPVSITQVQKILKTTHIGANDT